MARRSPPLWGDLSALPGGEAERHNCGGRPAAGCCVNSASDLHGNRAASSAALEVCGNKEDGAFPPQSALLSGLLGCGNKAGPADLDYEETGSLKLFLVNSCLMLG